MEWNEEEGGRTQSTIFDDGRRIYIPILETIIAILI